jgi:hypothetical protein
MTLAGVAHDAIETSRGHGGDLFRERPLVWAGAGMVPQGPEIREGAEPWHESESEARSEAVYGAPERRTRQELGREARRQPRVRAGGVSPSSSASIAAFIAGPQA